MMQEMQDKWLQLLRGWGVDSTRAIQAFEEISKFYSDAGRFYHTLDHIREVLATVESLGSLAPHLNAVRLAAWLHDVIYDSRASDNEERSAQYAERLCGELAIPDGRLVASLIMKTKTHDAGDDPDVQVLIDADLAILGAADSVYRKYAQSIRREYGWVPEPEYRAGRTRVLEGFLARPKIYHHLAHLENSARRNLAAEIARPRSNQQP